MDPKSLFSNIKRTFNGLSIPGTSVPAPFAIPKPAPFAMPKPGVAPTMGPTPEWKNTLNTVMASAKTPTPVATPFAGPVRPATPIAPAPVATAPIAPVVPTTSTGQTINTATGGIVEGATSATPPAVPTIPPPTTPTIPTAPTAVETAETAYKTAGQITPEQEAVQAEADRLAEAVRSGYAGTGQQAIPLEFITGQQKAIEERGLRLAEPLNKKLARMEAKRLSGLETSKFALERADKAATATATAKTAEAAATESARRFGIEQKGSEATRALAEKKFVQDTKQFGLDYALKARETAVKEAEAGTKIGGKLTTAGAQDLKDKAANIQTLMDDPALKSAVGPNPLARTSLTTGFTGARQAWQGGIKQLTSKETLDTLVGLKSKGGTLGALSDQERVMLQTAATKIGEWEVKKDGVGTGFYNVDEASFKKELATLKKLTERALANAGISTASNVTVAPDGSQVEIID